MLIDIIIVIVILAFILVGVKVGFTMTIINFVSSILTIVLCFALCNPVANEIEKNTSFDENINSKIMSIISTDGVKFKSVDSQMPKVIADAVEKAEDSTNEAKNDIVESTSNLITKDIMKCIAFLLIFIVFTIAFFIIKIIVKQIKDLPILHQFDSAGGIILGGLEGLIVVYFILGIISVIAPVFGNVSFTGLLKNSTIAKFMYSNNLLINLLGILK